MQETTEAKGLTEEKVASVEDITNKIIEGNSLGILKTFPDECINLIITSPPYFGCRVYGNETLGRESHPLDYIKNLFEFTKELKRVLKKNGSFYLNMGDVYYGTKGFHRGNKEDYKRKTHKHYKEHQLAPEDGKYLQLKQLLLLPPRLAIMMQEDGWIVRNQNLWEKPNPVPSFSKDRRMPVYEYFYHFVKSKDYYFDYETAKKLDHHRDIVRCGIESFGDHQATFPEKLIAPFIKATSKAGDLVLDPFGGSGTVGKVAKRTDRNYVLIELNPEYCEIARDRVKECDMSWMTD
jgi:site-specific DNA-methyltransferase (adenine-specific)